MFEQDRTPACKSIGDWRGSVVAGGRWWRYSLVPAEHATRVPHSYEWGRALLPMLTIQLLRYPQRMARTMPESLKLLENAVLT